MRIRIDLKIIIFAIIFFFTKQLKIYAIIMFFCFLHELGHIVVALILKMKIEKIEILPCGFSSSFIIKSDLDNKNYQIKQIIIALSGPIVSLIIAVLGTYIKSTYIMRDEIVYSNILIAFFNLLPIYPLDGGRILKGFLDIKFKGEKSYCISDNISKATIIIITIVSSIALYYFKNIAIFLVCLFLWKILICNHFERKKDKTLAILWRK